MKVTSHLPSSTSFVPSPFGQAGVDPVRGRVEVGRAYHFERLAGAFVIELADKLIEALTSNDRFTIFEQLNMHQ